MAGAALSVGTMTLLNGMPVAHATTTGYVVASAGSDTTEKVMNSIMGHELNQGGNGAGGGRNLPLLSGGTVTIKTYNIPTRPGISSPASPFVVPGESDGASTDCPSDVSWVDDPVHQGNNGGVSTETLAPNGSGAGATYIKNEEAGVNGHHSCIDIGRSSGGPGAATGGDTSTMQYYAFAMDAVSWATTSLKAPPTLTTAELQGIYRCQYTNWKNLPTHPGTDGQIQRYLPNPSSGTRKFFLSDVLQLTKDDTSGNTVTGKFDEHSTAAGDGGTCPAVRGDGDVDTTWNGSGSPVIEENEMTQIALGDQDKAIGPFSAGQWVFQAGGEGNPTIDQRGHARLGGTVTAPTSGTPQNNSTVFWGATDGTYELNTVAAEAANGGTVAGVVDEASVKAESGGTEATGIYPGIRFVYNILDTADSTRAYQGGLAIVGMDNTPGGTFKSPLCAGASNFERSAIASFGFAPLNTTGGGSHNNNASSCRLLP
jgi:hypothetical protein